jgi:hypothetical protein
MSYFLGTEDNHNRLDDISCVAKEMFEFKTDQSDFFLLRTFSWEEVYSMIYFLKIGNAMFQIPSGLYIVLADEYGTVDSMLVDEIIGRDVDALSFDKNLSTPDNDSITVIDARMKKHFWPNTNNIIPILSECKKRVVLLSRTDQWKTTKEMNAYDFV